MPAIQRYACSKCDFHMPSGWGQYTYAVDDSGKRVICPHPGEVLTIRKVTGMDYSEAETSGRCGVASHCVCLSCWKQFDLDWKRDEHSCLFCHTRDVRTVLQLVGKKCPRCKVGVFESGSPIKWKLDPDWESLPVPQIVKDLTDFANRREIPPSLRIAATIVSKRDLVTITHRLLDWWRGNIFLQDRPPRPSLEMKLEWKWCQVLPGVLQVTPTLAELIIIRADEVCFSETATPDIRRGLQNYIRKHQIITVWT